ncbi:hypothetical protein PSH84_13405 [Pseudomonas beijingensis]|uniref:Uncharacterized protein n=1 Tax=Pseudomonas beijingensis TaxID=2954101 RepID=A0ABY9FHC1_9PSED|nr:MULTISPECIES: hypothetical protein [unclassified Pseudomonas]WLH02939.1 hypothetical protein PSH92_08725 [Pseudomonas sp. FP2034]WLI47767.1 hypothetical protein PSH84_13405 [Pseudomonas sp. FP830]
MLLEKLALPEEGSAGFFLGLGFEFWVYIRFFGNGHWRFRSYSGSLLKSAKVSKCMVSPSPATTGDER